MATLLVIARLYSKQGRFLKLPPLVTRIFFDVMAKGAAIQCKVVLVESPAIHIVRMAAYTFPLSAHRHRCASPILALPSGIRGHVDLPQWNLQRLRHGSELWWHDVPFRVFALQFTRRRAFRSSALCFNPRANPRGANWSRCAWPRIRSGAV